MRPPPGQTGAGGVRGGHRGRGGRDAAGGRAARPRSRSPGVAEKEGGAAADETITDAPPPRKLEDRIDL